MIPKYLGHTVSAECQVRIIAGVGQDQDNKIYLVISIIDIKL